MRSYKKETITVTSHCYGFFYFQDVLLCQSIALETNRALPTQNRNNPLNIFVNIKNIYEYPDCAASDGDIDFFFQ